MNQSTALPLPTQEHDLKAKAANALMFIKMLLVVPVGILDSSLLLYMTHQLNVPSSAGIGVIASFIGCSGIMRIAAGYIGDHYISHRNLLLLSALFFLFGSILMPTYLYFGVTCITVGAGLIVSVHCLLTKLFQWDDIDRESAFIRNYSGMNIGYIVSFALSGYFDLHHEYYILFMLSGLISFLAVMTTAVNWRILLDYDHEITLKQKTYLNSLIGSVSIFVIVISTYFLIKSAIVNNLFILLFCTLLIACIIMFAINQPTKERKNKLISYLILMIPVLIFWTIYNLAPMAMTLFVEHNVNRHYLGLFIATEWVQLIIALVVVIGGPVVCRLLALLRENGIQINPASQFSTGLILAGIALVTLSSGIYFTSPGELVNFNWVIIYYTLLGIAELLVAPIGFALIGQLAPNSSQGVMMGNWMMLISIGAIFSGYISRLLFRTNQIITNHSYAVIFFYLGVVSTLIGIVIFVFLKKILNRIS